VTGAAAAAGLLVVALGGGEGGGSGRDSGGRGGEPAVTRTAIANVGDGPDGITVGGGRVWVTLANQGAIRRLDAASGRPVGSAVPVGPNPDSVVARGDSVWVTNQNGGSLRRLTVTGDRIDRGSVVSVGNTPEGVALGPRVVWVANSKGNTVQAVDRATNERIGKPVPAGLFPLELALGHGYLWVVGRDAVTRIDTTGARVHDTLRDLRAELGGGIAIGGGRVWVSDEKHGRVLSLRPSTGKVDKRIAVGRDPRKLAYGLGSVWVADKEGGYVTRIAARSGRVLNRAIPVGRSPIGVAVGAGSVWVANFDGDSVTRIRP